MNRSTSNDTSSEGYEYLALPFDPWPSGPTRDIIYRLGPFKGCVSVDAEADAQEILSVLHRALRDDVCSLELEDKHWSDGADDVDTDDKVDTAAPLSDDLWFSEIGRRLIAAYDSAHVEEPTLELIGEYERLASLAASANPDLFSDPIGSILTLAARLGFDADEVCLNARRIQNGMVKASQRPSRDASAPDESNS